MGFPLTLQLDTYDCGPSCLRMVCDFYGRKFERSYLRDICVIGREGVSVLGISKGAETIGLRSLAVKLPMRELAEEVPLPCVAHWEGRHFVVVHKVTKRSVYVADPELGHMVYSWDEFLSGWIGESHWNEDDPEGILLLLQPTPEFLDPEIDDEVEQRGLGYYFSYLRGHRPLLLQLGLGLLLGLVLDLALPFMTQAVVDHGIGNQDLSFITLILVGQLVLTFSSAAIDMLQGWIVLHVGARISISLISDFLNRLLKLPISFFDTRTAGDILQRIEDHDRIEDFLTSKSLNAIFSIFTFLVFGCILAIYNVWVLVVYLALSVLNVAWLVLFMKKRKVLDHRSFELESKEQDKLVELVHGVHEIKLQGIERQKRWGWEEVGAKDYRLSVKQMSLEQFQEWGSLLLGQARDVIVTFLVARAVVDGNMTLGMMLSTQYMIGHLSGPIKDLTGLVYSAQDAKLSLERMGEVYRAEQDEDYTQQKRHEFPEDGNLALGGVAFSYPGAAGTKVLDGIDMLIPEGKVTAIVGSSGSGKTTLLKLLLGLYRPTGGDIFCGGVSLRSFDGRSWRERCGVVMQDGFVFSDTIRGNIALASDGIDHVRLELALRVAHLKEYVDTLPRGLDTKIGDDGLGLSGGQKQRLLIARAVYKNPEYLFLDEATSALDSRSERAIVENLDAFMRGRTVVVIAHRLSTVQHADQIVVLDEGKVAEVGNHEQLVANRGGYYQLVKNQLELGGGD